SACRNDAVKGNGGGRSRIGILRSKIHTDEATDERAPILQIRGALDAINVTGNARAAKLHRPAAFRQRDHLSDTEHDTAIKIASPGGTIKCAIAPAHYAAVEHAALGPSVEITKNGEAA